MFYNQVIECNYTLRFGNKLSTCMLQNFRSLGIIYLWCVKDVYLLTLLFLSRNSLPFLWAFKRKYTFFLFHSQLFLHNYTPLNILKATAYMKLSFIFKCYSYIAIAITYKTWIHVQFQKLEKWNRCLAHLWF